MGIGVLGYVVRGFVVKFIAGADDTLARISVITQLTKSRNGKIAFSVGTFLALSLILIIALFFSTYLRRIPSSRFLVAGLITLLSVMIYFDIFMTKFMKMVDRTLLGGSFSVKHFGYLLLIGFIISFLTFLDDVVVLLPLFLSTRNIIPAISGIYIATFVQIGIVLFSGAKLEKFKYKREAASGSLLLVALFTLLGIV